MATQYAKLKEPTSGHAIRVLDGGDLQVPDDPSCRSSKGMHRPRHLRASKIVFDAAVEKVFGNRRKIHWFEVYAGEKANQIYGEGTWLPDDTLKAIQAYAVAIKGPLTTRSAAAFAASTSRCDRSSTSTPACGRCATSRASRPR